MGFEKVIIVVAIISVLAACATSPMPTESSSKALSIQQLEGAPLPSGATIDSKNSIIFGEGELWTGRVEIATSLKPEDAVKFFISQYPSAGWTLLSSTKSQVSILIFVGKDKTLTVEINERSVLGSGSKVTLTSAPKNK
ncbi:MAG: hypothetical protein FJY53_06775 [Betaproteobacteria bacterium]|nr:hypothetical protein [Betaproteobacteria bacterium]